MKIVSKLWMIFAVAVALVFIVSSVDAWWIFGPKKKEAPVLTTPMPEPQGKPFRPTLEPRLPGVERPPSSQPTFTPPLDCPMPLRIEVVSPSTLRTAHEGLNDNILGNEFSAKFKAVGMPPYQWTIKSSVEGYLPDEYSDDASRFLPRMWTISPSGTDEAVVSGRFDNSVTYCISNPEMLASGEVRDPITGYVVFPSLCGPDFTYFGEAWTVSVTDSCKERSVQENYAFRLESPAEKATDLLVAEIRVRGNDTGAVAGSSFWDAGSVGSASSSGCWGQIQFRFYDSSGNMVATSAGVVPEEEIWHTYRMRIRVTDISRYEDVNLEDISKVGLYMCGHLGDQYFGVTIHSVKVRTKFRTFYFGPGAPGFGRDIWWEVPYVSDLRFSGKEETVGRPPAKWQKNNKPFLGVVPSRVVEITTP